MQRTDISAVLNEWDLEALEEKGFDWSGSAKDLKLVNAYLAKGKRRGAWWTQAGELQALELYCTETSMDVLWSRLL